MTRTLLWFRDDLRTADHEALLTACQRAQNPGDVLALYVLDEVSPGVRPLGGAVKWWLHHALASMREELAELGIPLLLRAGDPAVILPALAQELGAEKVQWSRRYGGPERAVDAGIKAALPELGIEVESFNASLLHEPWTVQTNTGGPYKVYTPFWKQISVRDPGAPHERPAALGTLAQAEAALPTLEQGAGDLEAWELLPTRPDWAGGLRENWTPTEAGGHDRLREFLEHQVEDYDDARDTPAGDGTSRISPYLRFGQLSPRQVWHAAHQQTDEAVDKFLSEIGWREFCWHLLFHFPQLPHTNLRAQFDAYPWKSRRDAPEDFRAWSKGETGFPWVDAGQRQLWETGHMHNRVRMASASLLIKNLGIDWREGEAWFWDTLVDADAASNPANWQWVAGCGMDAAPYFRIFNPERQRERFDPKGTYVSTWIPELNSPDYATPIVDLKASREEALEHYSQISGK
ncbi:deoxyribodipyrimidine photolyase [Nesterenkonia sp. AN1]|uniref:Deoxyribodipyrimidine photo-lyase n=1 Tax=Nesterenkonia aurantiaca TaxID=1436010 RepID=A0A4R7G128_9MICC|nr:MULTISPECIES: deoxyribodipyrimidine photo-lyase [Nesterenkonia]EXF24978.1 deoxyribodipyrimidine photolyase [Nesterenkonia sp. AN1]TDS84758.1 deoxyribodipyrimidine photo-lyase [Nesterenkonia aurantiaca]